MNRSYNAFRLQFFQRRFHNIDPLNGLRIRCSRAPCAALRCARLSGSCRRRAGGLRLMAGRTRLSRVTRLASRGGRSGRMFRSGARSALHRSPLLRDAARGARARVPDCVLRLRPPARHRFPSRRHERHPRQGLSASESLKLRALRPHAFRTDSRPSASLKLVLFMAAPMLLAECYVVSEILLLIKPRQGDALAAFNKASAYAAALGIALLSGCVALQFSSVVAWRTWVDAVSALAYVAAGLPFIYVGLLEAASSPAAGRPSGRDARPSRRWSSISSSPTPPWSSGCSIPCSSAGGLRTTCT